LEFAFSIPPIGTLGLDAEKFAAAAVEEGTLEVEVV